MYGITGIVGNNKNQVIKSIKKISGCGRIYVVQNLSADKYVALSFNKTKNKSEEAPMVYDERSFIISAFSLSRQQHILIKCVAVLYYLTRRAP